ncbi:MAG: PQQ-binding-like beta-propeller repeat protein, partial [Verrucomicrobiales bacterium]
ETVATHRLPEKLSGGGSHQWGYVAFHNGRLFGTATMRGELEEKLRRRGRVTDDTTDGIFAIDAEGGRHLWDYRGGEIAHHTVAINGDTIYFIDSSISSEQRAAILVQDKKSFEGLSEGEIKEEEERLKNQDVRLAVAIDAATGEVKWSTPVDVTDCSEIGTGGGKLTLMVKDGVVLLCGANANGHYWKQFMEGEFSRRRLVALSTEDGSLLWKKDANYRNRPIIAGELVFAEPWAFDLHTGAQKMRTHPLTGEQVPWSIMRSGHHCGMITASANMLLFRSGFTGFYDLEKDEGTSHFAGHRTGCWINAIAANGLVSIPEASAGCVCLFSISSTIVMEPRPEREDWAIFSSVGANLPVAKMALNFGAPGDRRDQGGTAWLAYPRPVPERKTGLDLALDLGVEFYAGGKFGFESGDDAAPAGEVPGWVTDSGARGLKSFAIPLRGEDDSPADYRVRLHFAAPPTQQAPARTVDIRIQGDTVLEGLGVDAAHPLVREFEVVAVEDVLAIELVPTSGNPSATGLPVLTAIEVARSGG